MTVVGQKQPSALTSSHGSFVPATAIHRVQRQRQVSGQTGPWDISDPQPSIGTFVIIPMFPTMHM